MSIKYLNPAWETKTGDATSKLVLMSLADQANDNGICWPSIQGIAERSEISERQVIRILKKLEETGFITKQTRPGTGSGRKTNVYKLHIGQSDNLSPWGGKVTPMSPKPPLNLKTKEAPIGAMTLQEQKDEFWKIGVPLLTSQGKSERDTRTFLGKVVKDLGFPQALEAMRYACHTGDAVSYLGACGRTKLPTDRNEIWRWRHALGLDYQYDENDIPRCHAEMREAMRRKPDVAESLQ